MKFADQTGVTELITLTKTALKPLEAFKNSVTDVNGIVKSNGSGGFSAAVAGTDYAAASHTHKIEDVNGLDSAMLLKNVSIALPSGTWYDICYGEDRFVAVGDEVIAYSLDGFSWHLATSYPEYTRWDLVRYGNGKFIAMPNSAAMVAYSIDGITWTSATLPFSSNWYSLCYGGGKFVALAGNDQTVYSSDGITWTQGSMPDTSNWRAVCYGNGKFVAVNESNKAAYSTDGITWTANKIADIGAYYFIAYGEINKASFFVALQRYSGIWAASVDGITWSTIPSEGFGSNYQITDITFGNDVFVTRIRYEDDMAFAVLSPSSENDDWIKTSHFNSGSASLFCYGNGLFIYGCYSNNSCIFSTDGVEWNDGTRKNIVYPNNKIVTNEVREALYLDELQSKLESIQVGYVQKTGATMTGPLVAQTNTSYTTAQMRNIIISTADPSGGNNGDIWLKYEA